MVVETNLTAEIQEAAKRDIAIRSIFAHSAIDNTEIENALKETDEAIGNLSELETFVISAIEKLNGSLAKYPNGFRLNYVNMPQNLIDNLIRSKEILLSFKSPTPQGFQYLGRNNRFVQQLCRYVLKNAFNPLDSNSKIARCSVIHSKMVDTKTVIVQFRVRNVIKEKRLVNEIISEEMYLWAYKYVNAEPTEIEETTVKNILENAVSEMNISEIKQKEILEEEFDYVLHLEDKFKEITAKRTELLIEAHKRFRKTIGEFNYESVKPVLPPDIFGVYVILPVPKEIF